MNDQNGSLELPEVLQLINLLQARPMCPVPMARPLQALCCPQDHPQAPGLLTPSPVLCLGQHMERVVQSGFTLTVVLDSFPAVRAQVCGF